MKYTISEGSLFAPSLTLHMGLFILYIKEAQIISFVNWYRTLIPAVYQVDRVEGLKKESGRV